MVNLLAPLDTQLFVRERPIVYRIMDSDRLFRVSGVADLALWKTKQAKFYDIAPSAMKKIMTGHGQAAKALVADSLTKYVGKHIYSTDDESDAVAAGVSFLIREGYLDDKRIPVSK